jgi:hypothetical protein
VRRAIVLAVLLVGCRQNDDPDGARTLYANATAQATTRAPGWPERRASFTAHSREVEVFVNDVVMKTFDEGAPAIAEWPVGSIVRKDGYSGGEKKIVAVMEKRADGWHWAELDADGEPLWSAANGKPDICVECHDNRAKYSDWIYSFEFPR